MTLPALSTPSSACSACSPWILAPTNGSSCSVAICVLVLDKVLLVARFRECVPDADPFKVIAQAQAKLALNAAPVQIPLGLEEQHAGLVDLVTMQAHHFEGPHGQDITAVGSFLASAQPNGSNTQRVLVSNSQPAIEIGVTVTASAPATNIHFAVPCKEKCLDELPSVATGRKVTLVQRAPMCRCTLMHCKGKPIHVIRPRVRTSYQTRAYLLKRA